MKTIILISGFALMIFSSKGQIMYGFQAGTSFGNQSTQRVDNVSHISYRSTGHAEMAFVGGVVADIPLVSGLSVRPQANYLRKNFFYSYAGTYPHNYALDYVQVPVSFVWNIPVMYGKLYAGAGPVASLGLEGYRMINRSKTYVVFDGESNQKGDEKIHYNKLDLGVNFCAGYQISTGVFLDVTYEYGLSNINPDEFVSDIRSRGLSVKMGYLFGGSKGSESASPMQQTDF